MNKRTVQKTILALVVCTGAFTLLATADVMDAQRPGGANGTVDDAGVNAFSHPFPSVSREQKRNFFVGNSFFRDAWVEAPSSTTGRDGLGPTYNAVSCSACHFLDGRGEGLHENGRMDFSLLFRLSKRTETGMVPHPDYGEQLNPFSIRGVPREGKARVEFRVLNGQYSDGTSYSLREPIYSFYELALGNWENTRVSPRLAPQLVGLGFLEAISESDILAQEDPEDKNRDGISGRANWVEDKASLKKALGRFGWKANQPNLRQQNAAAFLGDMGITTSLFPEQNCPPAQKECQQAVSGGEPEASDLILDRVTFYTQVLAVPKRRSFDDTGVKLGEEVFHRVNCQACHTPAYVTGSHAVDLLSGQKIYPYTDLLLHDMGMELADHRPDGLANGREWKTPPLWGIGLIPVVNGHSNLMHDGRARNVAEAILWHGGEGTASREAFCRLSARERQALVDFVNSL